MSIDKKAFGITEVHTPADLDESMVSRYATQVVLGSKLKEMLDGGDAEPIDEDNTELDTLNLTEEPDDTHSVEPTAEDTTTEEPVTEDTIVEDTQSEGTTTEDTIVEDTTTEDPTPNDVIEDTQSNDQENTQSNDQEEITVDEETV